MASLLDEDGAISESFENCLKHIFTKYCNPKSTLPFSGELPPNAYLDSAGLDSWASDTNGEPFSEDTKEEILQFMDVTDEGNLTFKGFLQVYQLQTENDEEETWRDLSKHGYDRSLAFVGKDRSFSKGLTTTTFATGSQ